MQIKKRNEIDPAFQWDLTAIYPDRQAWQKDCSAAERMISDAAAVRNTLGSSSGNLKKGLDTYYAASQVLERVYLYAMLQKEGDNGCPEYQEDSAKATNLLVAFETATAFLTPEILSIDEDALNHWMELPELSGYRHILEDISRGRTHTLDANGEELLAKLSDAAQTPDDCFTMLESVDMKFPAVQDENGQETALSHGSYGVLLRSGSRAVRKQTYETYFSTFQQYLNTFAAMYSGSVKFDCYYADVRHYSGACERALSSANVPISVYDTLISAVHKGLPSMRRYLELRKKVLGLDELHMYDLYCPLVAEVDDHVTLEECMELVRNATKPLGPVYAQQLEHAFHERWMDIYENQGKTTGAFSCGVYGVHPFVLLNFQGQLEDAYTMVHELGHSMHSCFSSQAQDYANHDYTIMVAEVASTVNEVLLTKYLLGVEKDPRRRAYLLNHFLEGFRTTVFRQTLFAEFERIVHDQYEKGEALTAQNMNRIYRDLNLKYYDGCVMDELQDIEWARIPHFYNAFYVYQYATGFSSAVAIADRILKTGSADDYLKFLSTGGSDYPLEELKIAGIDLTKSDTVDNAMRVFEETLEELEGLLRQI